MRADSDPPFFFGKPKQLLEKSTQKCYNNEKGENKHMAYKTVKNKLIKIKKFISVTKKDITMREVIRNYRTGIWMSCPELIQRLIDKDGWKPITVNNFFRKSHTFTGGGILQNIITTSRKNMIEELKKKQLKTLDDDAEAEIEKTLELLNGEKYKNAEQFIIDCHTLFHRLLHNFT